MKKLINISTVSIILVILYICNVQEVRAQAGCFTYTVRVCECMDYECMFDGTGTDNPLGYKGCCSQSCWNDTEVDCPDDYQTADPLYTFGNSQCTTVQNSYPVGDARRNGTGSFFKALTSRSLGDTSTLDVYAPDPDMSNDIPVYSSNASGKKVPAVGISNNIFAFNYLDSLTEASSYSHVASLNFFTHGRSYSHIVITADGQYQFSLRANRSTTQPDPQEYYCKTTPTHQRFCSRDNGSENDIVMGGPEGDVPVRCNQGCLEAADCPWGCELDYRDMFLMWVAVQGDGSSSASPYSPANHNNATSIEGEFANYEADNEWKRIIVFNPHEINTQNPDDASQSSAAYWFEAGTYAIQMSGVWNSIFKMYNPKFYWSKTDAVNPFGFTEYPPSFVTSCLPVTQGSTCSGMTLVATPGSTMFIGDNRTLTATTTITGTPLDGVNDYVTFVPIGGGITLAPATVNATAGDTTFVTTVNGVAPGAFNTVNATLYIDGVATCTAAIVIAVRDDISAWWQVKDADVIAGGNITSLVPTSYYFSLAGAGGTHGLPIAEGSISADPISASPMWLVESLTFRASIPDFNYLLSLTQNAGTTINTISSATISAANLTSAADANGYEWYWYNSTQELNITSLNLAADRKVVIFAGTQSSSTEGGVNIGGTVKVGASATASDGGFLMIITDGDINVNSSVTNVESILFSGNTTYIQSATPALDVRFSLRGTLISNGGVQLLRELGNTANETTPAEYFEFAPDLILGIPNILQTRTLRWREVAPSTP